MWSTPCAGSWGEGRRIVERGQGGRKVSWKLGKCGFDEADRVGGTRRRVHPVHLARAPEPRLPILHVGRLAIDRPHYAARADAPCKRDCKISAPCTNVQDAIAPLNVERGDHLRRFLPDLAIRDLKSVSSINVHWIR